LLGGLEIEHGACGFAAGRQRPIDTARQRPVEISKDCAARIIRNRGNITVGWAKTKTMKRESCRFLAARDHGNTPQ
jgi:hypothetical protein